MSFTAMLARMLFRTHEVDREMIDQTKARLDRHLGGKIDIELTNIIEKIEL